MKCKDYKYYHEGEVCLKHSFFSNTCTINNLKCIHNGTNLAIDNRCVGTMVCGRNSQLTV